MNQLFSETPQEVNHSQRKNKKPRWSQSDSVNLFQWLRQYSQLNNFFLNFAQIQLTINLLLNSWLTWKKYIKNNQAFQKRSISILLDNALIHRAKASIHNLKEKFEKLIFIPPYLQQYAPIKHFFGFLKSSRKAYHTSKIFNIKNLRRRAYN